MVYSVHDIAKYICEHVGPLPAMKLHKLVYYAQAWSIVWDERLLFDEPIQAWANGPVVPALYEKHCGQFIINKWPIGDITILDSIALETIEAIIRDYGDKPAQWLSDLTHAEKPWRDARKYCTMDDRGSEITPAAMDEYYGSL